METNKLTNFVIFKDNKRLDMVKDILVEGGAYSSMTLEQRQNERNKYKLDKENVVCVNVLSEHLFIRKKKVA